MKVQKSSVSSRDMKVTKPEAFTHSNNSWKKFQLMEGLSSLYGMKCFWEAWLPWISHKRLSSVVMGGSIFFFVESKTFEFSVEEGGTYFLLRIFERSWNSLRSVFMGRESAKCLLAIVEELMSTKTPSTFARTFRDNEKVFILQLGSNSHGSFLMILELIHGRQKGLLVVP